MTTTIQDATSPRFNVQLSAVVVGTLTGLLIDGAFTLLGTGIGLDALAFEHGEKPSFLLVAGGGAFSLLATIISYGFGGYVAARLAGTVRPWNAAIHGLASFALAALMIATVIGPSAALGVGGLLARAGLGGNLQGSQVKIVTQFQTPKSLTSEDPTQNARQKAEMTDVREVTARESFVALALLVTGSLASLWGGLRGFRRQFRIAWRNSTIAA
jgi:hypothetical protein